MYDVIVVGSRVAGAATALLLARAGVRVLVVDRARFPSDTLSTHQVQVHGVARLRSWGLLDRIVAAGTPPATRVTFDAGRVVLRDVDAVVDGLALHSPRRTVLDALLVEAAREAGAEVRESFTVDELVAGDGRISGIRGRARGGASVVESASLVVGADGKRSLVAETVNAPVTREDAPRSIAYYTYWADVPLTGGAIVQRERRAIGVWPTNDGLTMTYVAAPAAEFATFRSDIDGSFRRTLEAAGEVGARVLAGRQAERYYGTADLPNRLRRPFGPGWALVGDAGLVMDPITGQGISHAFRDAELLSRAIVAGLGGASATGGRVGAAGRVGGGGSLATELVAYERSRDEQSGAMYAFTLELAAFAPPRPEQLALLEALAARPRAAQQFLQAIAGTISPAEFFSPGNVARIVGPLGMARLAVSRLRRSRLAAAERNAGTAT